MVESLYFQLAPAVSVGIKTDRNQVERCREKRGKYVFVCLVGKEWLKKKEIIINSFLFMNFRKGV